MAPPGFYAAILGACVALLVYSSADGADPPPSTTEPEWTNLPVPTLGGAQFWSDELVFRDWRIQKNVLSGHYRLLDDHDIRQHWGDWETCLAKFEELRGKERIPPMRGSVVILLHGLGRTRQSMNRMKAFLRDQGDLNAISIGYASTQLAIEQHAASLRKVIDQLGDDVTEIHFVCHSLGNLVVRHYLWETTRENQPIPSGCPARVGRMVMLGPPNQDASITRLLDDARTFRLAVRGTGTQLSQQLPELTRQWGRPPCDFAVIAGGKSDGAGWNPLLEGDDDLIVRVEETRLEGAEPFWVVPVVHTFLMDDEDVQRKVLRFLTESSEES